MSREPSLSSSDDENEPTIPVVVVVQPTEVETAVVLADQSLPQLVARVTEKVYQINDDFQIKKEGLREALETINLLETTLISVADHYAALYDLSSTTEAKREYSLAAQRVLRKDPQIFDRVRHVKEILVEQTSSSHVAAMATINLKLHQLISEMSSRLEEGETLQTKQPAAPVIKEEIVRIQ